MQNFSFLTRSRAEPEKSARKGSMGENTRLRSVGAKICRGGAFELARDMRLNFPLSTNYIALQKLEDDLIGDGHGATRHRTDLTRFC
jgi:hypothetical protein